LNQTSRRWEAPPSIADLEQHSLGGMAGHALGRRNIGHSSRGRKV
jgi:hypothetical protein